MAKTKATEPTLVLFVRHGQTTTTGKVLPGRAKGLHLAEQGIKQADAAASRIAEIPDIAAVYASPLERTKETAKPISAALSLRTKTTKGLIEAEFGDWTGKTLKSLYKLPEWKQVQNSPSTFRFPGGESFTEMQTRICNEVAKLAEAHAGSKIVCVSHADPIKAAVAQAMGIHLDLFQRIVISPCSITPIIYTGGSPIVLGVNTTSSSLADLVPS